MPDPGYCIKCSLRPAGKCAVLFLCRLLSNKNSVPCMKIFKLKELAILKAAFNIFHQKGLQL